MEYIDTSVMLSLIDKKDMKHRIAMDLLNNCNKPVITEMNIIEAKSVISRSTDLTEIEIDAVIEYIKKILNYIDIDMEKSMKIAISIVYKIKLKTLDCIHISNAISLNAEKFVTFDRDFKKKESAIKSFGISIINPIEL